MAAIEKAGLTGKIKIAMDPASSEFYVDGKYDLDFKNPDSDKSKWISSEELADIYLGLAKEYPIVRYPPYLRFSESIVLKTASSKMIGKPGNTFQPNSMVKSLVTISL